MLAFFDVSPGELILVIPIVAIVMSLGTGMLSIYFSYRRRRDLFVLHHEERMAAIDKGLEVPPLPEGFFNDEAPHHHSVPGRGAHGTLLAGLILMGVGLTTCLALYFTIPTDYQMTSLFALIPAGVGAALLIYYCAVGRRHALLADQERIARLNQLVDPAKKP